MRLKNAKGSAAITDDKGTLFINPTGENRTKYLRYGPGAKPDPDNVWMPTIDSPNEKMTQIYMTVEDKFTTLSNGLLTDSKKNPDGTRTDHWKWISLIRHTAMMAVGEFKKWWARHGMEKLAIMLKKVWEQRHRHIWWHARNDWVLFEPPRRCLPSAKVRANSHARLCEQGYGKYQCYPSWRFCCLSNQPRTYWWKEGEMSLHTNFFISGSRYRYLEQPVA